MAITIGGGNGNQIAINGSAGTSGQVVVSDGSNAYWGSPGGGAGGIGDSIFGVPPFTIAQNEPINTLGYSAGWYPAYIYVDNEYSYPQIGLAQLFGGTWQVHAPTVFYGYQTWYAVTSTRVA